MSHGPESLRILNVARRWWQDNMPHIGRLPTDAEVLRAYADHVLSDNEKPLPDWERELLEKQEREQRATDAQRAERRARLGPMPAEFEALAVYNAERWRGLVHTAGYDAEMAQLQCRFNEWAGLSAP